MSLEQQLDRKARALLDRMTAESTGELRRTSPIRTGNMRNETLGRVDRTPNGYRSTIIVDTDYARYVAEGTRPHVIRPRTAKALRFQMGGRTVFAASVQHPGTQPRRWWRNELERIPRLLRQFWTAR